VPYPYSFSQTVTKDIPQRIDAPILIIGDRLGKRFATFSKFMADQISENLSKPIKIESLALDGEGVHRTLDKIKHIGRLPLIIIYLGGGQEYYEKKFNTKDINLISKNFKVYNDPRVQTLLMIFPVLSKFIYKIMDRNQFGPKIIKDKTEYSDITTQKRNIINFKLYEQELNEMFNYIKEHNSYLIAMTTPINLDIPPKKSCKGSLDEMGQENLRIIKNLIKDKDYKSAYEISKQLTLISNSNAKAHFIHGRIAKKLGLIKEAQKSLEMASAYDCVNWRGSLVHNSILEKVAKQNDVLLFDFNRMLKKNWTSNITFEDDIYPQSFYIEKSAKVLASKIKKILKL